MNIKIRLNYAFQPFAGNKATVEVNGDTVKECLDGLIDFVPHFQGDTIRCRGHSVGSCFGRRIDHHPRRFRPADFEAGEILLMPLIQGG